MNNSNPSSEVKTKNITFGLVFAWILGVIVGIVGIITLFTQPIVGIILVISALIALPPVSKFTKEKMHFSLSGGLKVSAVIILLIVAIAVASKGNSSSVATNTTGSVASVATNSSTPTPVQSQVPIIVTATKLSSDYQSNEVSADAKYKGNLVQVSGTIYNIGKDIMDNPYIELQNGPYDPFGVQCMFSQSDESKLANLSKGQTVTLLGTVSSKVINVLVEGCQIK